jgi:NAD(P)-dependent dehydrogenase (short-subunit alcohol dehydrogenase family)
MSFDVRDRVAVVTGGSSGIGLATCEVLLRAGAKVVLCGRSAERLAGALQSLRSEFGDANVLAEQCDVLRREDCDHLAKAAKSRFQHIDFLINNAGQGRVATFSETTEDAFRDEFELKLFGVIHPVRAFLALLESSPVASIVCVNSLLALQPEPHMVATSAARAGLLNMVHSLAIELAPKKIRVNSVLIGLVESGQWRRRFETRADSSQSWEQWSGDLAAEKGIPLGRLGKPEEAAAAIVFLASPLSSYTTGSYVDISGGLSRHV